METAFWTFEYTSGRATPAPEQEWQTETMLDCLPGLGSAVPAEGICDGPQARRGRRRDIALVLCDPTGDILRAQRDVAKAALDMPCQRRRRWQQQEIMRSGIMETGVRHERSRPTGAQQYRIVVEFAARYRESGQWIERVMLNQADQAAGTDDPPHLAHKADPLRRLHVMQHADRYRKIEGCIIVRQGFAGVGVVLDFGVPGSGLGDAGFGDVCAAYPAEHASQVGMELADAAADIKHVETVHPMQTGGDKFAQGVRFGRAEEAVRKA